MATTTQDIRIDQRIDQLETRVKRLEQAQAVSSEAPVAPDSDAPRSLEQLVIDKALLRHEFKEVLKALGIEQKKPIGALELQRRMAQAGLETNELSQGIIAARNE